MQEKKLLDLPKLLDICAIYGHENDDLTKLLISNALKAQPTIHDNLTGVLSHFLSIVHTMHERCSTSLEVLLSSGNHGDHGFYRLHTDFLEVMDFINDAIVSMDAFITAYRPAAVFFSCPVEMSYGNEELLTALSRLHDNLLPSLQRGWIFMDDEQFQYLSGIMTFSTKGIAKEQTPKPPMSAPATSSKVQMDEDAAIMQSKISQVKDLFPDYGKGFIAACLEVYNQNPEEVIQRILEGTLHEDLLALDTSLETMPVPKSASTLSRNDKGKGKMVDADKGKGKLVDTIAVSSTTTVPVVNRQPVEGPSVSSSSTVGRFIRKSKDDSPDSATLDSRDENDSLRKVALISQYEYEDEYDDSFDDLGLSVAESGVEETEILSDKLISNFGKSQPESSGQTMPSSKWGSRQKPQYYVKDGKNYSYKVAGSVAVANANEASLVTQAQEELIHRLGRGGNLPLGAVKKLVEHEEQTNQPDVSETGRREHTRNPRGRGRRGGGRQRESQAEQENLPDNTEAEERGNVGNHRGRGRRGSGRHNNYRKDRAMNKHFSGLTGF
ncbi:hypothetical protein V6Z11_A01G131500 [Gossypium hirsutum]